MRLNELSVGLRDRTVSGHKSGEGYQKMYASLKVPKNTLASIILKWKTFGSTKTLPRAGCPAKLINRGRRALIWEAHITRMVTLTELQSSSVEMGEISRKTTICASLHQPGLFGRLVRRKTLLSKRHMTARLEFANRHPKASQTMRNKILWSDETKIELFDLNAKHHIWRNLGTTPTVKNGCGSIMLWG